MSDDRKRPSLWLPGRSRTPLPPARDALLALEARIRPDFKRAVAWGAVAIVCLAIGARLGGIDRHDRWRYVALGVSVLFLITGCLAVRSASREVGRITRLRAGAAAGSGLRVLVSVIGYLLVGLGALQLINVKLGSLLVGGAVTGVVLGIAAQQALGNFFAGLVLMLSRPYVPGQRVIIRSGALGGPFEGTIVEAGLIYTLIDTDDGPVNLPNAGLLAAAIGPAPTPVEPV